MLKVDGLNKSYDDRKIVKDVSFTADAGSFHALIGPSGTGKTTLMKMIAGLITPDKGHITINDERLISPEHQLVKGYEEIRLVHQDFDLKANMSVKENLNYALLGYTDDFKKERIDQLTQICKLDGFLQQPSSQLSGGQKQRVAIARALATEPAVILMDEPFSNLDPLTKYELLQETKTISQSTNTTFILVTHDTRDALEVADLIHVMIDGEIVQNGSPLDLYDQPGSLQIASLIGFMNILSPAITTDSSKITGIWAEDITLSTAGEYDGQIEKVIFKGAYQLISIKTPRAEHSIIAYDFDKSSAINAKVHFDVPPSKFKFFSA
ncbi:MAG: ABC-type Fe3+/spermidine/putrescine transport system ATPase subunit [Cyclobacteriaceae bacterium]|jgi:ABC-type Fe3+/spermidine/putrescine transport system ATPase subunit